MHTATGKSGTKATRGAWKDHVEPLTVLLDREGYALKHTAILTNGAGWQITGELHDLDENDDDQVVATFAVECGGTVAPGMLRVALDEVGPNLFVADDANANHAITVALVGLCIADAVN